MATIRLLINLFFCLAVLPALAIPAQIMIIPSAEKEATGDLSQKGLERAGALAPYFGMTPSLLVYGPPVAIFASRPTQATPPYAADDQAARCLQTVGPTAQLMNLPIHAGFAKFQEDELAAFILQNSLYEGKNMLICWHREAIADLIKALGGTISVESINDQSDSLWIVTYFPFVEVKMVAQKLLLDD